MTRYKWEYGGSSLKAVAQISTEDRNVLNQLCLEVCESQNCILELPALISSLAWQLAQSFVPGSWHSTSCCVEIILLCFLCMLLLQH